ncbi:MAG: dephospho-CoA kinase [Clostridiales bacterium]|nr:dephospho-CoA kinase [Clostridiales bacterium]MCF8022365.1 dephospho-CoA kinase [Clostridiales bacterium]
MIIGLTGNIGSGKSTAANCLESMGAKVIYTDLLSRQVIEPGKPALQKITETFGTQVLNNDSTLNREILGNIIFNDAGAREKLDSIVHPFITEELKEEIARYKDENRGRRAPALVVEVPLLFEAGMEYLFDEVWVVTVDKQVQIERIMQRDNINREKALSRISSQMPQTEKIKRSDRTIDNSSSPEHTRQHIKKLWKNIINQEE